MGEGAAVGGGSQRNGAGRGEAPHGGPAGGVAVQTDAHAPVVGGAVTQLVEAYAGGAGGHRAALQFRGVEVGGGVAFIVVVVAAGNAVPLEGRTEAHCGGTVGGRGQCGDAAARSETPHGGPAGGVAVVVVGGLHTPVIGGAQLQRPHGHAGAGLHRTSAKG